MYKMLIVYKAYGPKIFKNVQNFIFIADEFYEINLGVKFL